MTLCTPQVIASTVRHLAALPEPKMREAVLAERLIALPSDDGATLAGEIARRGPTGNPYDVALLSLSALLDSDRLPYDVRAGIYNVARERGDTLLVRLLLSSQDAPPGAPSRVAIPGRPDITLGERKSLARTRQREVIDRMLRDPDPSVLVILLQNPRLTEADVVRLAARRPTTAEAQREIFRTERFRTRYGVRRALVLNPYTPSDLASQLVCLLTEPDLKRVDGDAQLADPVRAAARAQRAFIETRRTKT